MQDTSADGDHILDRSTNFYTDSILTGVQTEGGTRERALYCGGDTGMLGCHDEGSWLGRSDLPREGGTGNDGNFGYKPFTNNRFYHFRHS